MSTRFFTNAGGNTLFNKFKGILEHNKDIEFFDTLAGFLRASGYFSIRPNLQRGPKIRILVGLIIATMVIKKFFSCFFGIAVGTSGIAPARIASTC